MVKGNVLGILFCRQSQKNRSDNLSQLVILLDEILYLGWNAV